MGETLYIFIFMDNDDFSGSKDITMRLDIDSKTQSLISTNLFNDIPDFFEQIQQFHLNNNNEICNLLHIIINESMNHSIPYNQQFEQFQIPEVFASMLLSRTPYVYEVVNVIISLAYNSNYYANSMIQSNIHSILFNIACNPSISKSILILLFDALYVLAKSNENNINLFLTNLSLQNLCSSPKIYDPKVYKHMMRFLLSLTPIDYNSQFQFTNIFAFLFKILPNITNYHLTKFLILLDKISSHRLSPLILEKDIIMRLVKTVFNSEDMEHKFSMLSVIRNCVIAGAPIFDPIPSICVQFLEINGELPFIAASEILINLISREVFIEINLYNLIKTIQNGSINIKIAGLDLLLMEITTFPQVIIPEMIPDLFETFVEFLQFNNAHVIEKLVIIIHSLLRQDVKNNNLLNIRKSFHSIGGVEALENILENSPPGTQEKINYILTTYYTAAEDN